jgi:hypothetical protein
MKGDDVLVVRLAAGDTVVEAASRAGMSRATATRRLADPTFRDRVTEARALAFESALNTCADGALEATRFLREVIRDDEESTAIRLAACKELLAHGLRLRESVEIAQRVAALEARLGGTVES